MAMRDILERQANSIEYVLHTHGIDAEVDSGKLSARLAHFHVVLRPGVRHAQLAPYMSELADALGVTACRLSSREDGAYLEVPRPDPVPVRLLPLVQRVSDVVPPITATLGLDGEGTPLLLRLNSPDVDPVVISGERGAGKSSLLRSMALSLALHNSPDSMRLLLLDCTGQGATFSGMESLPHLACPIANGPVDSLVSLRWALRALSRRAHTSTDEELRFDDDDLDGDDAPFERVMASIEPSLVIMVDGADELCSTGNRRADAETIQALNKLLAEGSRHDIHIVVSAERPDQIAGVSARWGARIAGRVASAEVARLALGMKGSGAQGLLGGGDFLISLNAELIRFQAGAVSQAELRKAIDLIVSCAQVYTRQPQEDEEIPELPNRRDNRGPITRSGEPTHLRRVWNGE